MIMKPFSAKCPSNAKAVEIPYRRMTTKLTQPTILNLRRQDIPLPQPSGGEAQTVLQ